MVRSHGPDQGTSCLVVVEPALVSHMVALVVYMVVLVVYIVAVYMVVLVLYMVFVAYHMVAFSFYWSLSAVVSSGHHTGVVQTAGNHSFDHLDHIMVR